MRQKVRQAKMMRDKQLDIEHKRKQLADAATRAEEAEQVKRLKRELEIDSKNAVQKKKEDMRRMNQIFAENDKHRAVRLEREAKEKEEDAKAMQQYIEILDKQEKDKQEEYAARERRVKENMDRMEGSVMAKINRRQREEEDKMVKYIKQREL